MMGEVVRVLFVLHSHLSFITTTAVAEDDGEEFQFQFQFPFSANAPFFSFSLCLTHILTHTQLTH